MSVQPLSLPHCPVCPRVLQDFAALAVGHCGPIPPRLCIGAARGNPTDQFSPTNLSKGRMAFDRSGFPVVKVNESITTSGAQEGAGGGSPFFSCLQQPQEQRCWAGQCLLPAGQAAPAGCAGAAAGHGETQTVGWRVSSCRDGDREGWSCPPPAHVAFGDLTPLLLLILKPNNEEVRQNQRDDP